MVCGLAYHNVGAHLRLHGLTGREYRQRFPGVPVSSEAFREMRRDIASDFPGAVPIRLGKDGVPETYWTRVRIVAAIRQWAREHNDVPPSSTDWHRFAPRHTPGQLSRYRPSAKRVEVVFGSWNAAVEAAGFPTKHGGRPVGAKARSPQKRCKRGHPLTPSNVWVRPNGTRECKRCHREYRRAAERFLCPWCDRAYRGTKSEFRKHVSRTHPDRLGEVEAVWTEAVNGARSAMTEPSASTSSATATQVPASP
jgi:hypothetical protein